MSASTLYAQDILVGLEKSTTSGRRARKGKIVIPGEDPVPTLTGEFWTSKQRAGHSLHEIPYRACFKPAIPEFFIRRFSRPGQIVYDPFMGRGTTLLEAALLGRQPWGNDASPLSKMLIAPRLDPPYHTEVAQRLQDLNLRTEKEAPDYLFDFYHPDTLWEICSLRSYFLRRQASWELDSVDAWIRMVCLTRLTGHSSGFFSGRTMPPNQAVSAESQKKINARLGLTPPRRDIREIIVRKSRALMADYDVETQRVLSRAKHALRLFTAPADNNPGAPFNSVSLIVTSPPFLDVVDYAADNWIRNWFAGVSPINGALTAPSRLEDWKEAMTKVFYELARILVPGGHIAFEVGEVGGGRIRLEETVVPCGRQAGLDALLVVINDQKFTKTANCWGVTNNKKGTNTNRVVVFRKPGGE